ncbi:alpha-amylase/4-alpha-glucanotransferase domain-containing protein [Candidatus Margulisiibacteriota bacterium]
MRKINFLFGIHCHQPVGNFEHVIEDAYNLCYLPFTKVMEQHPKIKFSFHFSGILYDWFRYNHPDFIDLLRDLIKRRQAEVLVAGHYEPILPIIPDEDKLGQIKMQQEFVKKYLKGVPRGLWLTERVWEPHLPKVMQQAGIEYVTVDDYHFFSAGIPEKELLGYYITEEAGATLKIFPISKMLRYLIPFRPPDEAIKYLYDISTAEGTAAAILADDGEKFGLWPGTHKWVYQEGYLENLIKLLEENSSWIKCMTFSEYIDSHPPKGRVYLPTASYLEMMNWALFTRKGKKLEQIIGELKATGKYDQYSQFFQGGYFRNFLVKYPEANSMHKKMLYVSNKVNTHKKSKNDLWEQAQKELFMGQCNCAYWHGVFGGLYLSYLRSAVYEHLIKAENLINQISRGSDPYTELVITDFDCDGHEEVLLANDQISVGFAPAKGATIFELDYKPKAFNIMNTLSRYEEVYHQKIKGGNPDPNSQSAKSIHSSISVKEQGLEQLLTFDKYRKVSLIDHFFEPEISMHQFNTQNYKEVGDFVGGEYNVFPQRKKEEIGVTFARCGTVETAAGKKVPIKLTKKVSLLSGQSILHIEYNIHNLWEEELVLWFAPEFNLALSAGHADDRYYEISKRIIKDRNLDSSGILDKVADIKLVDGYLQFSVSLIFEKQAILWRFPLETVSQSEGGLEKTYQGSTLVPVWQIHLHSQKHWTNKITIRMEN